MYKIQQYNNNKNNSIDNTKQQLINYIYDTVDLSHFRYELLQYDLELPQLLDKKYFVSANFSGSNCLLVFTKIRDKYHSFLVDRKTLSYNSQKVNIKNVKLTNIHVKLDLNIYQGTIFDGIYIQTKNQKTFVITDVYVFKGQDLTESQLDSKLLTIVSYLRSNYIENDKDNDILLAINRLYNINEVEHVVNSIIPKIKDYSVRGICFYPEKSNLNSKLIFLFGNETKIENKPETKLLQKPESPKIIQQNQIDIVLKKQIYIPKKTKTDGDYVFEMAKTNSVDGYMLYIVEPIVKDGKTHLKRKKIGLSFVPDINRSNWCEETLKNANGNVLVHCKFHESKLKWEPFLISTSKKPSYVNDFDLLDN